MYRNDEQESNAQEAYDTAFQEGCKGGYGAFRLYNEYEDNSDEENENQLICFEPINDADISVFYDLDSRRYDKSDANFAFVMTPWTPSKFEEEYPDETVGGWTNPYDYIFEWVSLDAVWLAEYYVREEYFTKIFVYTQQGSEAIEKVRESDYMKPDNSGIDKVELELAKQALIDSGYVYTKTRKLEKHRVRKYILSGFGVVEDCGYIAGENIPIIPYYGNRSVINGIERAWGQVQNGKDSQRVYNMNVSALAETASLSQEMKPIFYPEEIAGHETLWAEDNIRRNPYLLTNPMYDAMGNMAPSQGRTTQPRMISPATAALLDISNRDIQDVTGNLEQQQSVNTNTSGVAIQSMQNRLDMGVFGYMDNMAQTMRRCGEVWLSMRRAIEVRPRKVSTVAEDGTQAMADLMKEEIDPETGITQIKNDITSGRYKVIVDVAPSFSTRRDANLAKITGLMQSTQDPTMQNLLFNAAVQDMDGEGMQDLREFSRKQLVQQGAIKPSEEEAKAMEEAQANAQPDPQQAYLIASAEKEQALAQKAMADTAATKAGIIKTMTDAEKNKAQTAEIMQGIDLAKFDSMLKLLEKIDAGMSQGLMATAGQMQQPEIQQQIPPTEQ
jgi:hypothetical protein